MKNKVWDRYKCCGSIQVATELGRKSGNPIHLPLLINRDIMRGNNGI